MLVLYAIFLAKDDKDDSYYKIKNDSIKNYKKKLAPIKYNEILNCQKSNVFVFSQTTNKDFHSL